MKKNRNEIVRSLAMVTEIGVSMLTPILLCVFIGNWLDQKFGWSLTAVLLILGIIAGFRNTWILVKQLVIPDLKERQKNEEENK